MIEDLADRLRIVPSQSYGDGRVCLSGRNCVSTPLNAKPCVLSRYNAGDRCYCCQARERRARKALTSPRLAEELLSRPEAGAVVYKVPA